MNETLQTICTRKSVKKYKPDTVEKALIEKIVEAGTHAPTGLNKQSPIILAVTNRQVRDELSRLHVYDGSLVMANLLLAAHSLGLGACWIHRAKETFERPEGKALLQKLGIEGEYEGIGNCIVGYPDIDPVKKPRKENWVYYVD